MKKQLFIMSSALLLITACNDGKKDNKVAENKDSLESEMEMKKDQEDWQELFNGKNLDGWKAYNSDELSDQWGVENGAIVFDPSEDVAGPENLISESEFENFELSLEWKISEGGNSGVMWAVQESEEFSEPYLTGPEIQVLDNERHPDRNNGLDRTAGALYDLVAPAKDVTNPAGEWNREVIHIDYAQNEGWVELNGTRIVEFPLHGEEWEKLVDDSKFKDWEHFGKNQKGHIVLQDHGDKVWYRNIRIRKL